MGKLQWHPACQAGIRIELAEYEKDLQFLPEYPLGTKPMAMDILIINAKRIPIRKNIGRLFREWNVVEYKSPTDYLSIDDFYKALGYACFFKADYPGADRVKAEEVTLTLLSDSYPKKLIRHLTGALKYTCEEKESGIYYIYGSIFPVQVIVTRFLSGDNIWLKSMTNKLKSSDREDIAKLVSEYHKHETDGLYQSVMHVIANANKKIFQKEDMMGEPLRELLNDLAEEKAKGIAQDMAQNMARGMAQDMIKRAIKEADFGDFTTLTSEEMCQILMEKLGTLQPVMK